MNRKILDHSIDIIKHNLTANQQKTINFITRKIANLKKY